MLKRVLSILTLLLVAFASQAGALDPAWVQSNRSQGVSYGYQNKNGEIIFLESTNNSIFLPKVAAALEQAGYSRMNGSLAAGSKMDAWCKVDVFMAEQVLGECYTPQMGRGLSVRDKLATPKGDYSGVVSMIDRIRDEHRRASATLGIKS